MAVQPPKKNFEGENKKKDTYDADWVFVKNKRPKGPNQSAGAWMTKKQRKKLIQDQKEARSFRQEQAAASAPAAPGTPGVPGVPAVPATVPIPLGVKATAPGGADTASHPGVVPGTPTAGNIPGVPQWWIAQAYQNPTTEEQKFANIANAILPTLAPEDQRTLANYLAQNNKEVYGAYASTNFGTAPTEITDKLRQQFLSPQRAQTALTLLERMKQASGVQDMGAGYEYLKNAVGLMNQFSTNGVMTREHYQQFAAAVANLNENAGGALSSYANLSQLFNLPQFTAGPLVSNAPSAKLFS